MTDVKDTRYTRRAALRVLGQGLVGGAALTLVGGRALAEDAKCEGKIDGKSKQMRKALQYVDKSKKAGQVCSGCIQWVAPEKGATCGGCKLFSGPVNPNGYCLSFAPAKK